MFEKIINNHPNFLLSKDDMYCGYYVLSKISEYKALKKEGKLVNGEKFLRTIFLNIIYDLECDSDEFYKCGLNVVNYKGFKCYAEAIEYDLNDEMEKELEKVLIERDESIKENQKKKIVELENGGTYTEYIDRFFFDVLNCESAGDVLDLLPCDREEQEALKIWELIKFVRGVVDLSVDYEDDHMSLGGYILDFVRTFNVERFTEN
jgi:hypothetical protein